MLPMTDLGIIVSWAMTLAAMFAASVWRRFFG